MFVVSMISTFKIAHQHIVFALVIIINAGFLLNNIILKRRGRGVGHLHVHVNNPFSAHVLECFNYNQLSKV